MHTRSGDASKQAEPDETKVEFVREMNVQRQTCSWGDVDFELFLYVFGGLWDAVKQVKSKAS